MDSACFSRRSWRKNIRKNSNDVMVYFFTRDLGGMGVTFEATSDGAVSAGPVSLNSETKTEPRPGQHGGPVSIPLHNSSWASTLFPPPSHCFACGIKWWIRRTHRLSVISSECSQHFVMKILRGVKVSPAGLLLFVVFLQILRFFTVAIIQKVPSAWDKGKETFFQWIESINQSIESTIEEFQTNKQINQSINRINDWRILNKQINQSTVRVHCRLFKLNQANKKNGIVSKDHFDDNLDWRLS